jgi:hypothetical protein
VPDVGDLPPRAAAAPSATFAEPPDAGPGPESQVNRKPVVIGLGAVALVLAVVVAVLATRGGKPQETAQHDPPPVTPGPVNPAPAVAAPGAPVNAANAADKFAWPAPTANDFGLKVELDAPGKREENFGSGGFGTVVKFDPSGRKAGGKVLIPAEAPITLRLTAENDCRVAVWLLEPNGEVLKLFPNDDDTDDHLAAGKERVIPGNNAYTLEATPTVGEGVDRLRVIATTGTPVAYPPGTKSSRYPFYASEPERERLVSMIRGVVLKKAGSTVSASAPAAVSERELQFRVSK